MLGLLGWVGRLIYLVPFTQNNRLHLWHCCLQSFYWTLRPDKHLYGFGSNNTVTPVLINSLCPLQQLFESLGHMEDAHHSYSHQTGSNFMELFLLQITLACPSSFTEVAKHMTKSFPVIPIVLMLLNFYYIAKIKQLHVEPCGYFVSRQVSVLPGAAPFQTRHSLFKQFSRD